MLIHQSPTRQVIQNYIHLDKEKIESGEIRTQICDPDSIYSADYIVVNT